MASQYPASQNLLLDARGYGDGKRLGWGDFEPVPVPRGLLSRQAPQFDTPRDQRVAQAAPVNRASLLQGLMVVDPQGAPIVPAPRRRPRKGDTSTVITHGKGATRSRQQAAENPHSTPFQYTDEELRAVYQARAHPLAPKPVEATTALLEAARDTPQGALVSREWGQRAPPGMPTQQQLRVLGEGVVAPQLLAVHHAPLLEHAAVEAGVLAARVGAPARPRGAPPPPQLHQRHYLGDALAQGWAVYATAAFANVPLPGATDMSAFAYQTFHQWLKNHVVAPLAVQLAQDVTQAARMSDDPVLRGPTLAAAGRPAFPSERTARSAERSNEILQEYLRRQQANPDVSPAEARRPAPISLSTHRTDAVVDRAQMERAAQRGRGLRLEDVVPGLKGLPKY